MELTRSEFLEIAYKIAKEMSSGEDSLNIHVRGILEEFARKVADEVDRKHDEVNS